MPSEASEQVPLASCESGTRYIELEADAPDKEHVVCIRPDISTNVFFDAKVARVELAFRERFQVLVGEAGLGLLPMPAFRDGDRVPVTIFFGDGAAPASVTFLLVIHPYEAERQVMVFRHPRTLASYRQGERQARAEVQQCLEENARLQSERSGQDGLTALIAHAWMSQNGVVARLITSDVIQRSGGSLAAEKIISYRTAGPSGLGRVAVQVKLRNQGVVAWTLVGAALVNSRNASLSGLTVWPREPIPPGESRDITVEMDATENEARGTFTLKLWAGEAGAGGVSLNGVTFP
ncbi:hypothetical protein MEBOL_001842 [Melittangium boletus DSM 14713]|uniref:DUF2381 family protein n=2 Tax=Melittangium boletus TaxID=83453 RepID=A0A250I9H6_9BACT|nr:hypothetical protein MEBOL_001842 [Melittangium boletus DSM 14713]